MRTTGMLLTIFVVAALSGCGGGDETTPGGGPGNPAVPTLGAQIDRAGRPLASRFLVHAFDASEAARGAALDAWNADTRPESWVDTYGQEVQDSLAVLDGMDGVCGNQPLIGDTAEPGRYAAFADVLTDDKLWLKADASTCDAYFAVEVNAKLGFANEDCGGRTLRYDVVDQVYSALTSGDFTGVLGDGVGPDADTEGQTFPYLAKPH